MFTWNNISEEDLDKWQQRIYDNDASLFQFPSWLNSFKQIGIFKPRFIKCGDDTNWGYCGYLYINLFIFKVAIVSQGPVLKYSDEQAKREMIGGLLDFFKKKGITFTRFTGNYFDAINEIGSAKYRIIQGTNTFPYYNDVLKNFFVYKKEDPDTLKNSFNSNSRNLINRILKRGIYEFQIDEKGDSMKDVYELFVRLGKRKGFKYRQLESYKQFFKNNDLLKFCSLYIARHDDGRIVNAILIVRDKNYSLNLSGALDVEAIKDNTPPSKYIHYYAMLNEFYNHGTQKYNLVYSDGPVGEFKRLYNPEYVEDKSQITVVFSNGQFNLYSAMLLKNARKLKSFVRKMLLLVKK